MTNTKASQVQLEREMRQVNRRLDDIALQFTLLLNALKKNKVRGLDLGLEELKKGKVHKYRSVNALVKDVWG